MSRHYNSRPLACKGGFTVKNCDICHTGDSCPAKPIEAVRASLVNGWLAKNRHSLYNELGVWNDVTACPAIGFIRRMETGRAGNWETGKLRTISQFP